MYHAVHLFVQFTCKCSYYNVLLVRCKTSGFWYIIKTGPSFIETPLRYPAITLSHGDSVAGPVPSEASAGHVDGINVRECQLKALNMCLGGI